MTRDNSVGAGEASRLRTGSARFAIPAHDNDGLIDRIGGQWTDLPRLTAEHAASAQRLAERTAQLYDEESKLHGINWREYCKRLARRIRAQRQEIKRLHTKVRELRADVHERDERIAELERLDPSSGGPLTDANAPVSNPKGADVS